MVSGAVLHGAGTVMDWSPVHAVPKYSQVGLVAGATVGERVDHIVGNRDGPGVGGVVGLDDGSIDGA